MNEKQRNEIMKTLDAMAGTLSKSPLREIQAEGAAQWAASLVHRTRGDILTAFSTMTGIADLAFRRILELESENAQLRKTIEMLGEK